MLLGRDGSSGGFGWSFFYLLSLRQDGRASPEVDVGGGEVGQALVVATVVVVVDEGGDGGLELAGEEVVLQQSGKKHRQFIWLESWTDVQDEKTGHSRGMSLTLSEWFYEGILMDGGLLSIDPVYFSITGGRERWLYRVARKHAGGAGPEGFAIALPTLFEKSVAEGPYRRFKFEMLAIARDNNLPHFMLGLEYGKGEPLLRMTRREPAPAPVHRERPAAVPDGQEPPVVAPASPALPLFQTRLLSVDALERIRRGCPGWDLQELQGEFDAWIAGSSERAPANYEAAFYGFVRRRHARQA